MNSRRRKLATGLGGVALLVGAFIYGRSSAPPSGPNVQEVAAVVQSAIEAAEKKAASRPPDAAVAYDVIGPSLVIVQAAAKTTTPFVGGDDSTIGTGVIINADGSVMTALHVVAKSDSITLIFADGTKATATVETSDPTKDIAILTPDKFPEVLVPAVMGGRASIGDAVFAVGNPLGLVNSLSAGVISATDRAIPTEGGATLEGLIQFDAAVNPGNSGGPLLNGAGQVLGIVTGLANPSEQAFFVGIGFAVPIGAAAGGAGGGPTL